MFTISIILVFVWLAAMALSLWAVEIARMFARRIAKARRDLPTTPKNPPSVALILPVKGIDEDTRHNLTALLALPYPRLRFLFSVESENDPVLSLLQQITRDGPGNKAEIVIAGHATTRGQKIHNQLAAVDLTTSADDILIFMDADAHPSNALIPALVAPLKESNVGATTGYRLYVPDNSSLATTQLCIINSAIGALLGPASRNHAWGGAMAITRKNFFDLGVHDAWQNALSDDYVLSHQVRRVHKKVIQFSHASFLPSSAAFSWKSFFEFAPRQYKITRVCEPGIWAITLIGNILYFLAFAGLPALYLTSIALGKPDQNLLFMFLALFTVNSIRGYFLYRGCKNAFPAHKQKFRRIALWFILGLPLALFVNLLAMLPSALGRTIHWRGISYYLVSATKTSVLRRPVREAGAIPTEPSPRPLRRTPVATSKISSP